MEYIRFRDKENELRGAIVTGVQACLKSVRPSRIDDIRYTIPEVDLLTGNIAGKYSISFINENLPISSWSMTSMPGCHGLCIVHAVEVKDIYRGYGVGKFLNFWRSEWAKLYGYGGIISTDVTSNAPQVKIMNGSSYVKLYEFHNPKTHNRVNIHFKPLNQ